MTFSSSRVCLLRRSDSRVLSDSWDLPSSAHLIPGIYHPIPVRPPNHVALRVMVIEDRPLAAPFLEEVRQLLLRFPRIVVESVDIFDVNNWNGLILFLQEFNVKSVQFLFESRPQIPVPHLPFFLTNLDYFDYKKYVSDERILSATVKKLYLEYAWISRYTFMELLQKFANGDIVYWMIARNAHEDEDGEPDPFIEFCSQVMKIVKTEEIDWENMEPSVLYNKPSDPKVFYLRKCDGSIGKLGVNETSVVFSAGI